MPLHSIEFTTEWQRLCRHRRSGKLTHLLDNFWSILSGNKLYIFPQLILHSWRVVIDYHWYCEKGKTNWLSHEGRWWLKSRTLNQRGFLSLLMCWHLCRVCESLSVVWLWKKKECIHSSYLRSQDVCVAGHWTRDAGPQESFLWSVRAVFHCIDVCISQRLELRPKTETFYLPVDKKSWVVFICVSHSCLLLSSSCELVSLFPSSLVE